MDLLTGEHFNTVIIGAGMSGLAAGIRLALFDHKVIILERHNTPGGLNSFYSFAGRKYDVGLHALTNFSKRDNRKSPLNKLLRQLRLSYDDLELSEQIQSRIAFPGIDLCFSNDFNLLESEVHAHFPQQIDAFNQFVKAIKSYNDTALHNKLQSARKVLAGYVTDPCLAEMLLLPIFYYGSAQENDIDWNQFVIMFKALFLEGFSRPFKGVRPIIKLLTQKYKSLGGLRKMKCGVQQIIVSKGKAKELRLDSGDTITADHVVSSIGLPETLRLCSDQPPEIQKDNIGQLSFTETISILDRKTTSLGVKDTIVFFNDSLKVYYEQPEALVDSRSGVVCIPNNYHYPAGQQLPEDVLRITAIANYHRWMELSEDEYQEQKNHYFDALLQKAVDFLPRTDFKKIKSQTVATDMFTPKTINKYTGHLGGAVYGSPIKVRDGSTHLENLYICGTDQGFLGIIGAILSGISMANLHVLMKK